MNRNTQTALVPIRSTTTVCERLGNETLTFSRVEQLTRSIDVLRIQGGQILEREAYLTKN